MTKAEGSANLEGEFRNVSPAAVDFDDLSFFQLVVAFGKKNI